MFNLIFKHFTIYPFLSSLYYERELPFYLIITQNAQPTTIHYFKSNQNIFHNSISSFMLNIINKPSTPFCIPSSSSSKIVFFHFIASLVFFCKIFCFSFLSTLFFHLMTLNPFFCQHCTLCV